MFDFLKLIFGDQFNTDDTAKPGWRARNWSRPMKRASGRGTGRKRELATCKMQIEEFTDKDLRDDRYRALREQNTPDVSKFSTVRDRRSVWCVAHN